MVIDELKEIFKNTMPQCNPDKVVPDAKLTTDLGVDSLNMMLLAIAVEDHYNIRFESGAKLETVKDIVDYVESHKQ